MRKHITVNQAISAVKIAGKAGLQVGAFFIIGYPGENDNTILQTLKLSSSLPLDYVSYALPYPFPGTGLYDKVKDQLLPIYWEPLEHGLMKHKLAFKSDFSETKLEFALLKGITQFRHRKKRHLSIAYNIFDRATNLVFRMMR